MTDQDPIATNPLWLHFADMNPASRSSYPVIVRGEGCHVYDTRGRRYLDALAGLFTVQIGYDFGEEMGAAAAAQMRELPYYTNWSAAHPRALELAEELIALAPAGLERVFFVSGGSEAVETAWKLARQYHAAKGRRRHKVIARHYAYHGTTMGALSIGGLPGIRTPFEPLVPGVSHVSPTDSYRHPAGASEEDFCAALLLELEQAVERADPETVAMIILEPVQNGGGAYVPPRGYFEGVRALCDRHDILLCADEVITGFGRVGRWFGSERFGVEPDLLTCAKGLSSGHAAIGALLVSGRVAEPFFGGGHTFLHGITFGGHPVQAAVALKNIEIMRRERLIEGVGAREGDFARALEQLRAVSIVGDVRGAGYFWALELVKDQDTREGFSVREREWLLREFLSTRLLEAGLICRADDRGEPAIMLAPPLVADTATFDELVGILGSVLAEAEARLRQPVPA